MTKIFSDLLWKSGGLRIYARYNTIQYNIRLIRLEKTQTIQYMVIKKSVSEMLRIESLVYVFVEHAGDECTIR